MSYEKQTWANGDVITAEKLNHIEDGVYANSQSGGVLVVHVTWNEAGTEAYLDKTYAEISVAFASDAIVQVIYIGQEGGASGVISEWFVGDDGYYVTVDNYEYVADTATGVLTYSNGEE